MKETYNTDTTLYIMSLENHHKMLLLSSIIQHRSKLSRIVWAYPEPQFIHDICVTENLLKQPTALP